MYQIVSYGEILWDILPSVTVPGGAPLNVAYHLGKLGNRAALISSVGSDERGLELLRIMEQKGLNTDHIQIYKNYATGVVYANENHTGDVTYDIVSPVAWDHIQWSDSIGSLVSSAAYFIFGSLAARSGISRETLFKCLECAHTKVLDINLRPPHYNNTLIDDLLKRADVLKMNLNELELISSRFRTFSNAAGNTEDRMKLIQELFNIETIFITRGAEGAIVNAKGTFFSHPGFQVTVSDTVGSGDAFLAAVLHGLVNRKSMQHLLRYACALGALVATKPGACPSYSLEEVV